MNRTTTLSAAVLLALAIACIAGAKSPDDSKSANVTIKDLKYLPSTLKIKTGQTVLWTNEDDNDHTVISDDPHNKGFRSDNLGNGDTYRYTFEKPGKYPYHCKYHPRMKGMVLVTD